MILGASDASGHARSWPERIRLLFGVSVFWLALSMVSDGLTTLVLPTYLLETGDEASRATTLGLITFAGLLVGMLVQPLAGAWSDRIRPQWGRRGVLALGVLLLLGSLVALGLSRDLVGVLMAFIAVNVAASVAQAGQQGLLPDLVPAAWRGTASGFKMVMDVGGALVAFVLLGQLISGGELTPALVAIGIGVLVAFGLTIALVHEPSIACATSETRPTLRDAFRLDLEHDRAFLWLVLSRFLFLLGTYGVGRFLLFIVADRLGLDPGQAAKETGALLAGLTLLTVLAALPAGWAADRLGRLPLMMLGAGLSAVGTMLLIGATGSAPIYIFGALLAAGSAAYAGSNWALIADLAPPDEGGRFYGLANVGTAGASAAAGLFGLLVDGASAVMPGTGYSALLVAATLAFGASALATGQINRSIRTPSSTDPRS